MPHIQDIEGRMFEVIFLSLKFVAKITKYIEFL